MIPGTISLADYHAQRRTLFSWLIDRSAIPETTIPCNLSEWSQQNRAIAWALIDLKRSDLSTDVLTVAMELAKRGEGNEGGWMLYLGTILREAMS